MPLLHAVVDYPFMRHALLGGLLIAVLCSVLSFFVVQRGLSFAGAGIAHSAFAGLALGVVLNTEPILTGILFSAAAGILIASVSRKGRLELDVAIGIAFSTSMALGVMMISNTRGRYFGELFSYLFGNILAVSATDLWMMAGLTVAAGGFLVLFFRELLLVSMNEDIARAQGLPTGPLHYGLLLALALTVVLSVKLVGVVMASALLVIPGATGELLSTNYRGVIVASLVTALSSVLLGFALSYNTSWPAGATIVVVSATAFFLALAFSPHRGLITRQLLRR
ncbi:MAG: metal ABC transporter permease [Bacillota bacterium]